MKTKHIVPIIAGGILGAGAAVFAYSEIKRLKGMLSAGEEYIKKQGDCIRALDEVIKKKDEAIAVLKDISTEKDKTIEILKEMIDFSEEEMSILKNIQEPSKEPEDTIEPAPASESPSVKPKKEKTERKTQSYVFQYDTDFNVVAKYNSAEEAGRVLGLASSSGIAKALTGSNISGAGYFWSRGNRPLTKIPERWKKAAVVLKEKKKEK